MFFAVLSNSRIFPFWFEEFMSIVFGKQLHMCMFHRIQKRKKEKKVGKSLMAQQEMDREKNYGA